ncbi:MAG: hypothetical protein Q8K70_11300 [Bacteroidota bacterium]|nr:hypothetical protein [Bacteroidota bacterium]
MIKAVITGDIIASTKLTTKDREWLASSLKKTLKVWDKDFDMKSEMYRGDSFQCLLSNVSEALKVAILIKTYIRSLNPSELYDIYNRRTPNKSKTILKPQWLFDTRITIGIGEVESEMKSIKTSDGEAFHLSGRLLDEIKASKQTIAIRTNDQHNDELETGLVLLDYIIAKTTALQCEVVNLKLLNYTETHIANMLNIQQSAVNQRSNGAGWYAIEKMVKRFETIYE